MTAIFGILALHHDSEAVLPVDEQGGSVESEAQASAKGPRRRISGWRKWILRLVLATVVPALFFVLLEVGLRVCGFGYPTDFFVKMEDRDGYTTNQQFGWRFFPPAMSQAPAVCELPAGKDKDVYRIFVLGGSAAHGTPDQAFSFARMLEAMLNERYPQARFEVVNAAMAAINSHVVLPIARHCAAHQGDLFVIYMGNNEVVGPYGSGTIFGEFSGNLSVIRAGIFLKSTRIGQLAERIFAGRSNSTESKGMMMFLKQRVRRDDPKMEGVYSHFRTNLTDICDTARQSGAKVVLCTVPVNLRDCAPLASMHRANIKESEQKQWTVFHARGISLAQSGKHAEAVEAFDSAMRLDDQHAGLHFRMAQSLFELEQFSDARKHFTQARDLDALRFRADTRINRIIREAGGQYNNKSVYLVDAEREFASSDLSPHELPGRELFHEHVHMTPEGNYLLAKTTFKQITALLPDSVRKGVPATDAPSQDRCFELVALTDWDRLQMHQSISSQLQRAPFFDQIGAADQRGRRVKRLAELQAVAASPAVMDRARQWYDAAIRRRPDDLQFRRKFAIFLRGSGDYGAAADQWRYLLKKFPNMARWRLGYAELLRDDREFSNAISEFRQAMRIDPYLSDSALASIGKTLLKQNKQAEAESFFRDALAGNPSLPHAQSNLGAILYKKGAHDEAIRHFQKAIEIDPDLTTARINLAIALENKKDFPGAIGHYREFLRVKPSGLLGRHNLASLLIRTGRVQEGVAEYRQVLALQGDYAPTLLALARVLAAGDDPEFRDGSESVRIIERLCTRSGPENPALLRVLAMAYAETSQFDKAVATGRKALLLAQVRSLEDLSSQIQHELSLYKQAKPYRDPAEY